MDTSTPWVPAPGEKVFYAFDRTTGTVQRTFTKYRQTFAVVYFPGKSPREVPLDRLERAA